MTVTVGVPANRPWDSMDYQRIVDASFREGQVVVEFADGTSARVSPRHLVSSDGPPPDWSHLRAADFHIVVPSPGGEIEIPWDVIRVQVDPAFDAYWAAVVAERVG